ncbi:MAG: GIY-YIG nuclease family protein [Halobaculum sp.]
MSDHYVYLLRCRDGSLYTGYTTEPGRRVEEHDAGRGAKYTRGRTPVELVHLERHPSRSAALSREHEVKSYSRARKRELLAYPDGIAPAAVADADPHSLAVDP